AVVVGDLKILVVREQRRRLRAHVGEDGPAGLVRLIGSLVYALVEGGALRLAGLLEAAAGSVVEPAMIDAANAAVLEPAVREVGSPVGTVDPEQSQLSGFVAKEDEVLAHDPHGQGRSTFGQLLAQRDRLPVAAQHLSARRAWT